MKLACQVWKSLSGRGMKFEAMGSPYVFPSRQCGFRQSQEASRNFFQNNELPSRCAFKRGLSGWAGTFSERIGEVSGRTGVLSAPAGELSATSGERSEGRGVFSERSRGLTGPSGTCSRRAGELPDRILEPRREDEAAGDPLC